MKNELTISNTPNSMSRVYTMAAKAKESFDIVEALNATGNKTALALIDEQKRNQQFQVGYVFGSLKANLDCLPEEIAARQKMNGIPLDFLIKMKVDEFVLDVREVSHAQELTGYTDYEGKYRRLSECICGFGYNMSFIEERFESFFPNGIHRFVLGFAVGYSETFHEIAAQACIKTEFTDPKTQDIWRNWEFFLKRDVHEYRLDGNYLFMYHGGFNCTGDSSIPYGNNSHYVNKDVYETLKSRKSSDFVDKPFEFDI